VSIRGCNPIEYFPRLNVELGMKTSRPKKPIESIIMTLRGQKVILDADLAELYGVPVKVLNQAVKRNGERFPEDFMFQLTEKEWLGLRSQFVTANAKDAVNQSDTGMSSQIAMTSTEGIGNENLTPNWSQFVTSSTEDAVNKRHRGAAYRPYAFTEHGALQAANVLSCSQAVQMSLFVIRAFMKMREELAANAQILKRLGEIDKTLLTHDAALRDVYQKLLPLLSPPAEKPKRRIGFHTGPGEPQAKGQKTDDFE
jgi:hypothetical protein